MSGFCDLALAFGLTLSGNCAAPTAMTEPMPMNDPGAWAIPAKPEPPPPPPAPPPAMAPAFPPVVVYQPAPPPPPPPPVDPYEQAVAAAYRVRAGAKWEPVSLETPAPFGLDQGVADLQAPPKASTYKEKSATSTGPVDNSRVVTTDRYIAGIVETGINTQLDGSTGGGGPVVIQTSRDVYGYHSRNVLIPKGSRLVCEFKSLAKVGSSRAPLKCSRVLLGGSRAEILSKADITDMQGELGVSGDVDDRFMERYGTAFILAGISTAVQMAVNATSGNSSSAVATTSTGSLSSTTGNGTTSALSSGSQALSQQLGQITAATLQQTLNLAPILKVPQGTRIQIRPEADWYIAKMESNE